MPTPYQFENLSGVRPVNWDNDLHFIGTGMTRDYDLRWMSTAPVRRDFGSGISGSHFSASVETSYRELRLSEPYPEDSYHIRFGSNLRLLDLRNVPDPNFSGQYYNEDRSISCQIVEANREFLKAEGYDGILRYSKASLDDRLEEVIAVTPEAIGKLSVREVRPLGVCSAERNIITPDGDVVPMRNFYPEV